MLSYSYWNCGASPPTEVFSVDVDFPKSERYRLLRSYCCRVDLLVRDVTRSTKICLATTLDVTTRAVVEAVQCEHFFLLSVPSQQWTRLSAGPELTHSALEDSLALTGSRLLRYLADTYPPESFEHEPTEGSLHSRYSRYGTILGSRKFRHAKLEILMPKAGTTVISQPFAVRETINGASRLIPIEGLDGTRPLLEAVTVALMLELEFLEGLQKKIHRKAQRPLDVMEVEIGIESARSKLEILKSFGQLLLLLTQTVA